MTSTSLHRKVAKAVRLHRKVVDTVQSRRVHRHVFRYAVAAHFVHVAVSAGSLRSVDAVIAFAASLGTLLMHITEKGEESTPRAGITGPQLWCADLMFGTAA